MKLRSDYDALCERYLFAELSDSEAVEFEKAYFADDGSFERFLYIKDELLDAYARGELKGKRLERFEEHYLATEARRQRVEDARDLIRVASAAAPQALEHQEESRSAAAQHFPVWRLVARSISRHPVISVAALLVIVVAAWIAVRQVRHSLRRATDEQAKTENANHSAVTLPTSNLKAGDEKASPNPSPSPRIAPEITPTQSLKSAQIASLTLLPVSTRETGSANSLLLRQEQRGVHLTLVLSDDDYYSFDVSVRTVEGEQVVRRGGLKATSSAQGKIVTVTFDASLLSRQDYIVSVMGRGKSATPATVAEYYFSVQHIPPQ